jgi:hypothetical protein
LRTAPATRVLVENYPTPSYLPRGYEFAKAQTGRALGFLPKPENQLTLWATNERRQRLMIVIAPDADNLRLYSRKHALPRVLSIETVAGEAIPADYYDGRERYVREGDRLDWETSGEHALVLRSRGHIVAIVGDRRWGVDRMELIRVAASLA